MFNDIIQKILEIAQGSSLFELQNPVNQRRIMDMFSSLALESPLFSHAFLYKSLFSLLILMMIFLLRRVLTRQTDQRITSIKKHYYWKRSIHYSTTIIGIIIIGSIWIKGIQSLVTFFGIVGAGIAVALKDVIVNLAGWFYIIWIKPFRTGERIEIGEYKGDVIDITLFNFSILEVGNWVDSDQSTGRILEVPNGILFREGIANYSKGFNYIWDEIPVLVTFESDWKKTKKILERIANEKAVHLSKDAQKQIRDAAKKYMIIYKHLTPIVYTEVKDSGVLLTMRYLTKPHQRRSSRQSIWEEILTSFAREPKISLAYNTTRFYRTDEGF
jgi:small-conductance mechanosensitive channel